MNSVARLALALSFGLSTPVDPARADAPLANYVFPAGGQRGTTVAVIVGGCNLNQECSWQFDGPGIIASPRIQRATETVWFEGPLLSHNDSQGKEDYPRDYPDQLVIADDASPGIHHWRAWTSQGVTSTMRFVVGDLPEFVEAEIEGEPIPVPVALPLTINGRIFPREDVDIWTIPATAGESITCEVHAARLGYPLLPRIEVRDPDGRRIAEATGNLAADARVRFEATQTGPHQVRIHDIRFTGSQSHVYRLTITQQPYVEAIYPLGGQAGTTIPFLLAGQRVPHAPVGHTLRASVSPANPTAAVWESLPVAGGFTNPLLLDVDRLPEYVEPDAGGASSPMPVNPPAVLNGRIRRPGESDHWSVGSPGTELEFAL